MVLWHLWCTENHPTQPSTQEPAVAHQLQGGFIQLEVSRRPQQILSQASRYFDGLDHALPGNTAARSPAELSLSQLFRQKYSSVYVGIENLFVVSNPEKPLKTTKHNNWFV